ncbi:MAG: ATP-binding protein [Candidatus Pacearchaeota archaeon]|nr:ATP-binding protein [Candidatus Pacearchaeota archaeon]
MNREELYSILFEQQKDFEDEKPTIPREMAEKAIKLVSLEMPLVITGIRRCGKSFLLKIIKDKLNLKDKDYFYINFNDDRLIKFEVEDFQKIIDFINEQNYKEKCFLFIDEIQEVSGWEKWIDRIKSKYKIFITGSNSRLLSSELATILTGRSISLCLTPLSFREFLQANKISIKNWKLDSKEQTMMRKELKSFIEIGGIPKRVITGQNIVIKELYEDILYKDIIKRFAKLDRQIKEMAIFFFSNPSSLISLRTLSKMSKLKNIATVKSILESFESSFLFFFINKFDYSIKTQIQNPRKVYCIDNSFLINMGFRLSEDKGKLLENLIAIELKRREKEIFYYSEKYECDFLVRRGNRIKETIQVTYELNEKNREREIAGLIEALNKFKLKEGLIITSDQEEKIKVNGKIIRIIPAWKWLLEE